MKLSIDVGTEQRTLVAGIAEAYEPERSSAGRSCIVFNLKPAKLMGIESNGMVLAASPDGGKPVARRLRPGRSPPGTRSGKVRLSGQRSMIDSHCHLADEAFAGDLDGVVARAQAAGVHRRAVHPGRGRRGRVGARRAGARRCGRRSAFAIGVHPHQRRDVRRPRRAGGRGRCDSARRSRWRACAVGEIGLDYHYDFAPRDVQQAVFAAQVALARELGCPVIIHTREADRRHVRHPARQAGRRRAACSTASPATPRWRGGRSTSGFYISFSGIVTFPEAAEHPRGRRASCPTTGCWSKPTARTWRPCRTAASGTSRHSWRGSLEAVAALRGAGTSRSARSWSRTSTQLLGPTVRTTRLSALTPRAEIQYCGADST